MNRRTLLLTIAVILAISLSPVTAKTAEGCVTCSVDCAKIDDGIRCTVKTRGDAEVGALRECVRACEEHSAMDGVSVSFEEIEDGIVVVRTAEDTEVVKALQDMAKGCAKNGRGFCPKGADADCCSKHQRGCCKGKLASTGCDKRPAAAL